MKRYPETLYVSRENEGDEDREFLDPLTALEDAAEVGKEKQVAVYQLKEIVTVRVHVETIISRAQTQA